MIASSCRIHSLKAACDSSACLPGFVVQNQACSRPLSCALSPKSSSSTGLPHSELSLGHLSHFCTQTIFQLPSLVDIRRPAVSGFRSSAMEIRRFQNGSCPLPFLPDGRPSRARCCNISGSLLIVRSQNVRRMPLWDYMHPCGQPKATLTAYGMLRGRDVPSE